MNLKKVQKTRKRNQFLEKFFKENSGRNLQFRERVKELTCMYNIAQCVVMEGDLDIILKSIVKHIPAGWQFPESVFVKIQIHNEKWISDSFPRFTIMQSENIYLSNEKVGVIEVHYKQSPETFKNQSFLKEEQDLLSGISHIIGLVLKQHENNRNKELMQRQLLHADRLATIGQLAAGFAHELNEPLTNILGFTQLLIKHGALSSNVKNDLMKIEEASLHAKGIISKLMEFARQSTPKMEKFNLSEIIEKSLYFIEARCIKEGISLKKELDDNVIIHADAGQIKQVVTNLSINSMQAMKQGGHLTVKTQKDSQNAFLIVQDNGEGIPRENIDKIFMPFFTTKDVGEGTGLGLSVVYGIVKSHGGEITVSDRGSNKGTTFQVSFPLIRVP